MMPISSELPGMDVKMRTHIFIDFENVQPSAEEFARIPRSDIVIWLLHGAHQHEFAAALVRTWLPLGERIHIVQSTKTGKNAVDLLLAVCLGDARREDEDAGRQGQYVVVSGDKDFDALDPYLKQNKAKLQRVPTLAKALELIKPLQKPKAPAKPATATLAADVAAVLKELRAHTRNRPTTRTTLERHIHSMLGGNRTDGAIQGVVKQLEMQALIQFDGTKVAYKLK
jgi:hypothetical protein